MNKKDNLFRRIWNALPWGTTYQKISHYVWLFATAIALVLGAVFCNTSDQIYYFVVSVCAVAQLGSVGQELIRWAVKKDAFDAMNFVSSFVGFIEGGFLGTIIWFIIQNC